MCLKFFKRASEDRLTSVLLSRRTVDRVSCPWQRVWCSAWILSPTGWRVSVTATKVWAVEPLCHWYHVIWNFSWCLMNWNLETEARADLLCDEFCDEFILCDEFCLTKMRIIQTFQYLIRQRLSSPCWIIPLYWQFKHRHDSLLTKQTDEYEECYATWSDLLMQQCFLVVIILECGLLSV